jgi:hypothetical protein
MSDFHKEEMRAAQAAGVAFTEKNVRTLKTKSAAFHDFFTAAERAKQMAETDGIIGSFDEDGGDIFSPEQGIKAACHGREDTSAVLMLQLKVLQRLDRNRNYMIGVIVLLLFVLAQHG